MSGIGGVNIVVKADVHRSGINFPAYAFENQCETEGFAKMAERAGFRVVGLPNYVVWISILMKRLAITRTNPILTSLLLLLFYFSLLLFH